MVSTCAIYPIAVQLSTVSGVVSGTVINDILNGPRTGNYGWLTWTGDQTVPALAQSLRPPGNSNTYTNPFNLADRAVSAGDWVRGSSGASNSSSVRNALNQLTTIDITVPVWNATQLTGDSMLYRVVGFARVRITSYALNGANPRITARYLGTTTCSP